MRQPQVLPSDEHIDALNEELRRLPRHLWDERLWAFCEAFVKEASRPGRWPAAAAASEAPRPKPSSGPAAIHKLRPVHSRPN